MSTLRVIARLDLKGPNLVKGIQFEGVRVIGDPNAFARRYYQEGADELLLMDLVASLYQRNALIEIIQRATREVFVPITVGGGVRSVADAQVLLRAGADKVALNTAAVARPALLGELAQTFGAQCVVLSIEAKRSAAGGWEAFTDNGREPSGREVVAWAREGVERGAGEILLTSVDREGSRRGFDLDLVQAVAAAVPVPVIACGGMGRTEHALALFQQARPDAIAMAAVLHYGLLSLGEIRQALRDAGAPVRSLPCR